MTVHGFRSTTTVSRADKGSSVEPWRWAASPRHTRTVPWRATHEFAAAARKGGGG